MVNANVLAMGALWHYRVDTGFGVKTFQMYVCIYIYIYIIDVYVYIQKSLSLRDVLGC